jgi:chromosome segregation ATPase
MQPQFRKACDDVELLTAVLEETSKEGSDLRAECTLLSESLAAKQADVERLRGIESEAAALAQEKAELLEKCHTKDTEAGELQATVAELLENAAKLADQVSVLTADRKADTESQGKLRNEVAELSALLAEKSCRVETVETELNLLKESTTNQIRDLEQQIELRTGQLQLMNVTLSNVSMLVAPLHAGAAALVEGHDSHFGDSDDEDLFS